VIWQVELDDALSDTKMIAEAWDAAGLYQIGHFPGDRWSEWNGRYRDDVRRFVKGEPGLTGTIASRIGGSSDIYQGRGQTPQNTINFITCHDGFTMNDLVSYNTKHNEANGEGNRDGTDNDLSWNCGVEGETTDPEIEGLRERQIRNFVTILMLSRGVPMILAGDEIRRTQGGNNNAYNQDNATSWFDWTLAETNRGMLRFWRLLLDLRKHHSSLRRPQFYSGETNERGVPDIVWHGTRLNTPGFDDPEARVLAFTIAGFGGEPDLHVMMNMFWEPLDFEVPSDPARAWRLAIDTSHSPPGDIFELQLRPDFPDRSCTVQSRSIVVLAA
jgi:glycogen operon protein